MDRLPDIRNATPSTRPETNDRKPRENGRAARSRSADKSDGDARATSKVNDRQRTERPDSKQKDHRFEVHDQREGQKAEQKPEAKSTEESGAQNTSATKPEQDITELIAQKPTLRAQSAKLDPVALTKSASKQTTAEAVSISLPVQIQATVTPGEAAESRPVDLHVDAHPVAQAAPQNAATEVDEKRALEAPKEARETKPPQDLERAADILRQVRVQFAPRNGEAHIDLQPRELGRVSIHITVEDGKMRTEVRAEKREALDAIQAHLPELRATLRDSGIVAQDFTFSLGLQNQPRRDPQGSQGGKQSSNARTVDARDPEHAVLLRATASASGVDLYA